jgi:hypothetical protein
MSHHRRVVLYLALLSAFLPVAPVFSQEPFSIRDHYDKIEQMIPMRDGVKLFTSIFIPKDRSKTYPIIMTRTPYSVAPYGTEAYPRQVGNQREKYFRQGFIVVNQDVRGCFMSEGTFVNVRPYVPQKRSPTDIDETSDTYDTIEWLLRNVPNNNGRVGVSGISYPGFYTSMAAIDAHPALAAASPQAPVSVWFGGDDFYHNGAFLVSHAFDFFATFGRPRTEPTTSFNGRFDHGTPDGYAFYLKLGPLANANARYLHDSIPFWNELTRNSVWNDYWEARNVLTKVKDIKPAMMTVGGWFDEENLFGALNLYKALERNTSGYNVLVMGPWSHGGWARGAGDSLGFISWGSPTSTFYTDSVEAPFFNYYLKGEGSPPRSEAIMFQTGENRWRFLDRWPPAGTVPAQLYLREGGKLAFTAPAAPSTAYDEYVSDPAKPVPYTLQITHWYNPAFSVEDQRFAARRPDVLVYESDELTEDVTVAGPIIPSLFVSTSGTDCDWVVKLVDVFPDTIRTPRERRREVQLGGYQMLVRGDVLRGKFRNSLAKPEPFVPGEVEKIEFTLNDIFHTFKKGHRIMVQIQSTWFPKIDRNPGTFVDVFQAKESDFRKTTQRVYRSASMPSCLKIQLLKGD